MQDTGPQAHIGEFCIVDAEVKGLGAVMQRLPYVAEWKYVSQHQAWTDADLRKSRGSTIAAVPISWQCVVKHASVTIKLGGADRLAGRTSPLSSRRTDAWNKARLDGRRTDGGPAVR